MPLYTSTFANLNVAGNALGTVLPANHNMVAWAYDPALMNTGTLVTNGTQYFSAVYIPRDVTITKIYWSVTTGGATPTAGQNEVGIYSSAGTKLQSTNVDAVISAGALKTTTITAQALSGGSFYWVGMVFNAGTAPTLGRGTALGIAGELGNLGLTAASYRFATNGTGKTALDASITPASNTATTFAGPWVAVGV